MEKEEEESQKKDEMEKEEEESQKEDGMEEEEEKLEGGDKEMKATRMGQIGSEAFGVEIHG